MTVLKHPINFFSCKPPAKKPPHQPHRQLILHLIPQQAAAIRRNHTMRVHPSGKWPASLNVLKHPRRIIGRVLGHPSQLQRAHMVNQHHPSPGGKRCGRHFHRDFLPWRNQQGQRVGPLMKAENHLRRSVNQRLSNVIRHNSPLLRLRTGFQRFFFSRQISCSQKHQKIDAATAQIICLNRRSSVTVSITRRAANSTSSAVLNRPRLNRRVLLA